MTIEPTDSRVERHFLDEDTARRFVIVQILEELTTAVVNAGEQ